MIHKLAGSLRSISNSYCKYNNFHINVRKLAVQTCSLNLAYLYAQRILFVGKQTYSYTEKYINKCISKVARDNAPRANIYFILMK